MSDFGTAFFEASALDKTNVNEAFIEMTKEVMKNSNKKAPVNKKENVNISNAPSGQTISSGKGCC